MAEAARDLWPPDIDVKSVVPPVVILREQASLLAERTRSLVRGEVESEEKLAESVEQYLTDALKPENRIEYKHTLVLVTPALESYRYVLLSVRHDFQPYPCRAVFHPDPTWDIEGESSLPNEQEFVGWLKHMLARPETKRVIQALLYQAQES
ncbi:MAG TPA: hypothetical protein VMY37_28765 [Thermoguttaceae bacterium]|nr:hypothetical protein [Thermoguttaceae bacterium]